MSAVSVANRESPASRAAARPRALSLSLAVVAALTVLGLAIRIANFDQSLLGDELSSYWVIKGHSFGHMLSILRSDAEITPPLFFVFAWLSSKLGSNPDLIRLPSLIAGTATIPLVYVLGSRTVGRTAGLIGAAVMALSPYMIYYSVEARSYAVMIALVTASTVALLAALRTGRMRWWAIYAACSLGALYSHYTCLFPLAAQFLWVLWAHREAFRPLLVANLAVLIGFAPWIPGFLADSNSPTTQILYALQPFTFDYVRATLETWAMGYPYVVLGRAPGDLAVAMIATGVLVAACAVGLSWVRSRRSSSRRPSERLPSGLVLVAMLALAAPLGEAIVAAVGPDLLGGRNLNASWPGLALAIGTLLSAAPVAVAVACGALVFGGYGIGAIKTLGSDLQRPDFKGAANAIEARWAPGDVVVDVTAPLSPVPLTGLDAFLPQTNPEYRLGLPSGPPPFTLASPLKPPAGEIEAALTAARGHSLFALTALPQGQLVSGAAATAELRSHQTELAAQLLRRAKRRGFEVSASQTLDGIAPFAVIELDSPGEGG